MTKRTRRNHTPGFEVKVAMAAIKGDRTLAELTQLFDVHPNQITTWKAQLLEGAASVFGSGVFASFSENDVLADGSRSPVWFAFDETRPLTFFAGIWTPQWKSVRKVKEGETANNLFAFLTTDPNKEVATIHPKAKPVILTTPEGV